MSQPPKSKAQVSNSGREVKAMAANSKKRLILCCDGTWMDADDGFVKPTLIPYVPTGTLQVPSNVTRISRAMKRDGLDGTPQIIYYHSGVGTGSSKVDALTGGILGTGISENIREVYSFVAANYTPGDEIVLLGFSRGAFTVRSIAAMIGDIGLLTREGMNDFYPIFKDIENINDSGYHDIFPDIPFPHKPDNIREYKRRLEKDGFTRVYDPNGEKIRVQAVGVWDTVGALGIPNIALLSKLGLPHSTKEYRFEDTTVSNNIRHAFQALALDEHRHPFQAAVWERQNLRESCGDLRQVWFPGAHANVGGGYDDQEIANISLAWMMDQLASIGVAFQHDYIDKVFEHNVQYYENPPRMPSRIFSIFSRKPTQQWAIDPIYEKYKPIRPWGLGKIWNSEVGIWRLAGKGCRTPGLNKRANPMTGIETNIPMTHTNERIHSSVRVRLELDGLGLDDKGLYKCHALEEKGWRPRQMKLQVRDSIPWDASWPGAPQPVGLPPLMRWVWEYEGREKPDEHIMVEEPLGPYERKLLLLTKVRGEDKRRHRRKRRRKPKGESQYDHGSYTREEDIDSLADDRRDRPRRAVRERPRSTFIEQSRYTDEKRYSQGDTTLVDDKPSRVGAGIDRYRDGSRYRDRSTYGTDERYSQGARLRDGSRHRDGSRFREEKRYSLDDEIIVMEE